MRRCRFRKRVCWGDELFSQKTGKKGAELGEASQCYFSRDMTFFNSSDVPWHYNDCTVTFAGQKGPEFHLLLSLLFSCLKKQTFVNCMQQMQTYHYFEIVYVKVIFLHVDCCYFVFRNTLYQFFVKRWKVIQCVLKMCHIENVVRSKASKIFSFSTLCLYFWEHFWGNGMGFEIKKVYDICFMLHAHDITIFNCIFKEIV